MVEVYKTDVFQKTEADLLLGQLSTQYPHYKINFDLDDCDKVLRVEGEHVEPSTIQQIVNEQGFFCEVLD